MANSTAWTNTQEALTEFMLLLVCNKCKQRPTNPIRYTTCFHLFCLNCIKQDDNCFECNIPVQPADIRPDHDAVTMIESCDSMAEIVYADGDSRNAENITEFHRASKIFSSTRVSEDFRQKKAHQSNESPIFMESNDADTTDKGVTESHRTGKIFSSKRVSEDFRQKKAHKTNMSPILSESDDSGKTDKMPSDDDTVRLNESDDVEAPSTLNSIPSSIIPRTNKSKKFSQSQKTLEKNSKKVPKDVNKKNRKGETLLHLACIKKQEEEVRFLLEHNANPNTKDNADWTPLQEAICYGLYNICEMLLENGADPNTPGVDNKTALHEAVIKDHCKEAALLLRYNASQNVFDNQGKKPIDYCTTEEMKEVLSHDNLLNQMKEKCGDTSLNRSSGSTSNKYVILPCDLDKTTSADLQKLASKHKHNVKIVNTFVPSVTHVIIEVESDEHPFRKLTYDILLSILHGKWILSSDWIQICLVTESEDLREVDLEVFEVKCITYEGTPTRARLNAEKQKPGLFNNCSFFFALNSSSTYTVADISFTKKNLTKLVVEGGGTCLTREPNPEYTAEVKRIPFHVAHDENNPLHQCSYYIIYSPGREEPRMKYKMPHLRSLPLVWFIECIERFALVDPGLYGI